MKSSKIISCILLFVFLSSIGGARVNVPTSYDAGYALSFDSGYQLVTLPSMTVGGSMAIECLINPRGPGPFLSFGWSVNQLTFSLTSSLNVRVTTAQPSPSSWQPQVTNTTTTSALTANTWTYLVINIAPNAVVTVTAQVNGVQAFSDSKQLGFLPVYMYHPTGDNYIGSSSVDPYFWGAGYPKGGGDIDQLRIWSRVLTSSEQNQYRTINTADNSLVAFYNFDEGVGRITQDQSNNGYDAYLGSILPNFEPRWIATSVVSTSTCKISGNPTVSSFDQFSYGLNRTGQYWLVKNSTSTATSLIQVNIGHLTLSTGTITGIAFTTTKGDKVILDIDFRAKVDSLLTVNGVVAPTGSITTTKGTVITKAQTSTGHTYTITVPNEFNMLVTCTPSTSYNDISVRVGSSLANLLTGLCGNNNGNINDETQATTYPTFDVLSASYFPTIPETSPLANSFSCEIATAGLSSDIKTKAGLICLNSSLVDASLTRTCLSDICITGLLSSAYSTASLTYQRCMDAASRNGGTNSCIKPCLGFCSFSGVCQSDGTCACNTGYSGSDCSQQTSYPCYQARWGNGASAQISPFIDSKSIIDHYGYSTFYLGSSNTGMEVAESTVMYLYQQRTNGASSTSFVLINDKALDGTAGAANMSFIVRSASSSAAYKNVSAQVFDDPSSYNNDKYQSTLSTNGTISAQFKFAKCCTSGLALGPLTNDFCIDVTTKSQTGISQTFVSSLDLLGSQELQTVDKSFVSICGTTCQNTCGSLSNCSSCASDSRCGWCIDTKTCELGGPGGPTNGQCRSWRYSTNPNVSRVVTTNIDYPVTPSQISVYMPPNMPLSADFYVNFPSPQTTPLELVLLQDVTSDWALYLPFLKYIIGSLFDNVQADYFPNFRMGLASFSDKPIAPYGNPNKGDYVYQTNQPLTSNIDLIVQALGSLQAKDGGQSDKTANAQLEALMHAAIAPELGWSEGSRRVVLVLTSSAPHVPPSTNPAFARPNNLDYVVDSNEDYPSPDNVRDVLLKANVIPIFIAPSSVLAIYQSYVASWKFGATNSLTILNVASAFADAAATIRYITATATVVNMNVTSTITTYPSTGYTGISPQTRVDFTATLPAQVKLPATINVPGFGSVQFTSAGDDRPKASCTVSSSVDTFNGYTIVTLSGYTPYQQTRLTARIASLPDNATASLFQVVNGNKGARITVGSTVTSTLLQVYVEVYRGGNAQFTFNIYDDCLACSDNQICTIPITHSNQFPTAFASSIYTTEDSYGTTTLRGTDPDGDALIYQLIQIPSSSVGVFTTSSGATIRTNDYLPADHIIVFTPAPDVFGLANNNYLTSVSFTVTDPYGASSQAIITVYVTPVNDAPTAVSSSAQLLGDTSININMDGFDAYGEDPSTSLIRRIVSTPSFGILTTCDGCPALTTSSNVGASVIYKPNMYFSGQDSFTFKVTDSQGLPSNIATITLSVLHVNHAPSSADIFPNGNQDTNISISLSGTDPDGDSLSYFICLWNGQGSLYSGSSLIPSGSTNVATSQNLVYVPVQYSRGMVASFTFKAQDNSNASSMCYTASITLFAVNHVPSILAVAPVNTTNQDSINITLSAQDVDGDHPLIFSICNGPSFGSLSVSGSSFSGSVSSTSFIAPYLSTLMVTYTPSTSSSDYTDSFSFRASDGQINSTCTSVRINVAAVVFPSPVAVSSSASTNESVGVIIYLNGSSSDVANFVYSIVSFPSYGTLYRVTSSNTPGAMITSSTAALGHDNRVFYVPPSSGYGSPFDNFSFKITSAMQVDSTPAVISIMVTHVPKAPVAAPLNVITLQDQPLIINLIATTSEMNVVLSYSISSLPINASLVYCEDFTCNSTHSISAGVQFSSSYIRFSTPYLANDKGNAPYATFSYSAFDATNQLSSNLALVSVGVTPVDYPPVAGACQSKLSIPDPIATPGTPLLICFGVSDPDGPYPIPIYVLTGTYYGSIYQYVNGSMGDEIINNRTMVSDPTGLAFYLYPLDGFQGNTRDGNTTNNNTQVIQYQYANNSTATNTILVGNSSSSCPQGLAPVVVTFNEFQFGGVQINNSQRIPIFFGAINPCADNTNITVTISRTPLKGNLYWANGTRVNGGSIRQPVNLTFYYQPPDQANSNGTAVYDYITYIAVETNTSYATNNISLIINPLPSLPVITSVIPNIAEDTPTYIFAISVNDPDLIYETDNITAIIDLPIDSQYGGLYQVNPDNTTGALITSSNTVVQYKRNSVGANQAWLLLYKNKVNQGFYGNGVAPFTYHFIDRFNLTAYANGNINIYHVNHAPTLANQTFSGNNDQIPLSLSISFTDSDVQDQQSLFFDVLPTKGYIEYSYSNGPRVNITINTPYLFVSSNVIVGSFYYYSFVPFASGVNYDTLTIRTFDGTVNSSAAHDYITFNYYNTPPRFNPTAGPTVSTKESTSVRIYVNVTDPELSTQGCNEVYQITVQPKFGNISYGPSGNCNGYLGYMTYTPTALLNGFPYNGVDTFMIKMSDGIDSYSQDTTATINILAVNNAPTFTYTGTATATYTSSTVRSSAVITALVLADDASEASLAVNISIISSGGLIQWNGAPNGLMNFVNTTTSMTFRCLVSAFNGAFTNGLIWTPTSSSSGSINVTVNDLGGYSQIAGDATYKVSKVISISVSAGGGGNSIKQQAVSGAFVGVTTILSALTFGVYGMLKKKNIIPEEIDPWENDEVFDVTLDNPLFSSSDAGLAPLYE